MSGAAPRAGRSRKRTRIQIANEERILDAAVKAFADHGFRGATIDQIAEAAGMSKPNLLYYFSNKQALYQAVLERILDTWLQPLKELDANGDPRQEIRAYIRRKLEMSRTHPVESRLFATEIIQGAPVLGTVLQTDLRTLVDAKAKVIKGWIDAGLIADVDPHHLLFMIWAMTQHYADFAAQIGLVLGTDTAENQIFSDAEQVLDVLTLQGLLPR